MTPEQLANIQARADAATEGPWKIEPVESGRFAAVESHVYSARGIHILLSPGDGQAAQATNHDAEFIAAARTDVPALLALVREQQDRIERVRELHVLHEDSGKCIECTVSPYSMHSVKWPCPTIAALTATEGAQ